MSVTTAGTLVGLLLALVTLLGLFVRLGRKAARFFGEVHDTVVDVRDLIQQFVQYVRDDTDRHDAVSRRLDRLEDQLHIPHPSLRGLR